MPVCRRDLLGPLFGMLAVEKLQSTAIYCQIHPRKALIHGIDRSTDGRRTARKQIHQFSGHANRLPLTTNLSQLASYFWQFLP